MLNFHASARACLIAGILLILTAFSSAQALAANPYAYGEVARFGGFDSSAYNGGNYGGALTHGKFLDPTGFAVDTQDASAPSDTALYVVDRTSGTSGAKTSWRLQKLDDQGNLLGATTFELPNASEEKTAVVALAVDDTGGRVYALLAGNDELVSEQSYAKEIVAWSIHPEAGKLVAATAEGGGALPADPLHSTGGLVSEQSQLVKSIVGGEALYNPQGLVLDVDGTHRDVAIEATDDKGTGPSGVAGLLGSAVVQQVDTHTGALNNKWSATQIGTPAGETQAAPRGISTNPDGSLTVLLGAAPNGVSNVDVVKLSADLSSFSQLLDSEDTPTDFDRVPAYLSPAPGPYAGFYVAQQPGAGPGLVQLNGASGLYAATFETSGGQDGESRAGTPFYWTDANPNLGDLANIGVRLLLPKAGGEISDGEGGTIVNTLGGATLNAQGDPTGGGVCNLDAEAQALATGANGSLWLLGAGVDTVATVGTPGATVGLGREIIELAPGAGSACQQPSGGFTASKSEVTAGSTVEFNAESVNLQHGVPFVYEWDLDNEGFKLVNKLGLWPRTEGGVTTEVISWPPPTATFKYTQPGQYTVKLRIVSEYGTYEAPSQTITVVEAKAPLARFNVATAAPTAGQQVFFNASESSAFSGASIKNYHWEWGDGSSENVQSGSSAGHTYAVAGTYTVKLTVEDSNGLSGVVFFKEVAVSPAEEAHTATSTSTSPHSEPPPPDHSPTSVNPQASAAAGGVLKTTVSCPASKISCAGTVQVKTAAAVAAVAKKGKKKAKKSQLVLGSSSFSLPGGTSKTLTIHLSAQGMALLSKSKSLRVLVVVSAHDSFGDARTQTLSVTLRAPAKKHGHGSKH